MMNSEKDAQTWLTDSQSANRKPLFFSEVSLTNNGTDRWRDIKPGLEIPEPEDIGLKALRGAD